MTQFPQVLENVFVRQKDDFQPIPENRRVPSGKVERALGDNGRVVVRYSGTEPLARVMVEGEDYKRCRRTFKRSRTPFAGSWGSSPNPTQTN